MKVMILTCHNVYNCGASLQVYALQSYLESVGYEVEILNYIPKYLDKYSLTKVNNPKYNKPVIKQLYILSKLVGRLKNRKSQVKRSFDMFTKKYLSVSSKRYSSLKELKNSELESDIWVVGSDQVWNPLFENGKDPAFFLSFVRGGKKFSYAASISTHEFKDEKFLSNLNLLSDFEKVSVRERSSICDLRRFGIESYYSCDPVFLLKKDTWIKYITQNTSEYAFYYIFCNSSLFDYTQRKLDLPVHSYFDSNEIREKGPFGFLSEIYNAKVVVSNSFHATAFAILFNKDFYVLAREDCDINIRMKDLLNDLGLYDRYITNKKQFEDVKPIDWKRVNKLLDKLITCSRNYLKGIKKYV